MRPERKLDPIEHAIYTESLADPIIPLPEPQPNGRAGQAPAAGAMEPPAPPNLAFPEIAWRGIFADYRAAMQGTTEACDAAHFATLWVALAAALGRRVSMYSGDTVFPNVYLAVFGDTGDKKTTAARRLISYNLLEHHPSVRIIRNVGSTEGLAEALSEAETGRYVFFWEEFSSLLARARWTGSTLLEFMTETFDCPDQWGTKYRKNSINLTNPTPSIITSTTVEWFWKFAKPEDFFGGFGNRFLFLSGPKKPPITNPDKPDDRIMHSVKKQIEVLADRPIRHAVWTPGAQKVWDEFYLDWEGRERKGLFAAAVKRAHVYVRKLAMTYAEVEATMPNIHSDQLRAAIGAIQYSTDCTERLIEMQASQNKPQGELEQILLKWVAAHEGERVRRFQQLMWKYCGDSETFNRVKRNLELADRIEIRERRVYLST